MLEGGIVAAERAVANDRKQPLSPSEETQTLTIFAGDRDSIRLLPRQTGFYANLPRLVRWPRLVRCPRLFAGRGWFGGRGWLPMGQGSLTRCSYDGKPV